MLWRWLFDGAIRWPRRLTWGDDALPSDDPLLSDDPPVTYEHLGGGWVCEHTNGGRS